MAMKVRYTVVNGEVLSENRNGVQRDYVPDSLGSTVALLDNTQAQTDTFTYWPYGEVQSRIGTTPTPFQFVGTLGYYQDSSTRTYVRARYLDVAKGRWMTQDPIGFDGGDADLYRYVGNDPASRSDRSGMSNQGDCVKKYGKGTRDCFDCAYLILITQRHYDPEAACGAANFICKTKVKCDPPPAPGPPKKWKKPMGPCPGLPPPPAPGRGNPNVDPCWPFTGNDACWLNCRNGWGNPQNTGECQDCCDEIAKLIPPGVYRDNFVKACHAACGGK